jgi:hypothetical protein
MAYESNLNNNNGNENLALIGGNGGNGVIMKYQQRNGSKSNGVIEEMA